MINLYYLVAAVAYGIFLLSNLSYLDLDGEFDMDVSDVVSFKGLIQFSNGFF